MNFNRINNLTGWVVFAIAATVYTLTLEPTGSLWDCGEFISSCFKLQIPHPPGAPLFVLLGRLFIILFGDDPMNAARAVNWLSAMASAGTILFLFWTITHFARKLVQQGNSSLTSQQIFIIISAGAVGALAYTFSDSFWFSAVEGEVYASSSLFTAIVFWAALKWESQAHQPGADRWLVFIFFMMGLSIGVHLLNLLTIPAIIMVYYFKRYKPTVRGTIFAFIVGCVITGLVQKFIIQYTIKSAGWFDIHFVNDLGMPFFTGFAAFFILLTLAMMWTLRLANRKRWYYLRLGVWNTIFMLLGYSTYLTTMIRSNADPAVDIFNVDSPVSLAGYLGREQYGDWPIVYGPDFTDPAPYADGSDLYTRTKHRYEVAGQLVRQDWSAAPSAHLFPRMWDNDDSRQQAACYRQFTGLEDGETPTMADNLKYFAKYQASWMYMRYFMWNFAGRQNDIQGFGNPRDSNWISGISMIDNTLYGNQHALPDSVRTNKAYNRLYMLPLLLGIAGIFFQYRRNRKDFLVNLLLFFFTGLAIVIYINQSGYQPRERDYAYVGSFYAFSIWIGLGVLWTKEILQKLIKSPLATYASVALCLLAVPALMAQQEWDDHDRSHKTLARDLAKDYLESCPPNAILFTFEDNDTYPLWYAQEVEGIRPDVRVVITTLLGTDWLMNQLRYKINKSAPVDVLFTKDQVAGDRLGAIYYANLPGFDQDKYYDLYSVLKDVVGSDDPKYTSPLENGGFVHLYPSKKFSVPVDVSLVKANGTVNASDKVVNELRLDLSGPNHILKNDLAILAIIAANKWKRPVCFTNDQSTNNLGLQKYLRKEGMSYRLVPVENGQVNNVAAYKNIMQKFAYGNAGHKGVYFDEENRHRLNTIRLAHADVALSLAQAGNRQAAVQVLEHYDKNVRQDVVPYGMVSGRGNQHNAISAQFLQACYMAGDKELTRKVHDSLKKDLMQQMRYYRSLGDENVSEEDLVNNAYLLFQGKSAYLSDRQLSFVGDILSCYQLLHQLAEWEKRSGQNGSGLLQ